MHPSTVLRLVSWLTWLAKRRIAASKATKQGRAEAHRAGLEGRMTRGNFGSTDRQSFACPLQAGLSALMTRQQTSASFRAGFNHAAQTSTRTSPPPHSQPSSGGFLVYLHGSPCLKCRDSMVGQMNRCSTARGRQHQTISWTVQFII